jgi:Fe-S oxidoreductase
MRVCGSCHFGDHAGKDSAPAAALVLAFSSTQLHGPRGIVKQIENMCEKQNLPSAAAYCSVCRRCTWLCRADADINEACVEFLHTWRTTEQIAKCVALMHKLPQQQHLAAASLSI